MNEDTIEACRDLLTKHYKILEKIRIELDKVKAFADDVTQDSQRRECCQNIHEILEDAGY